MTRLARFVTLLVVTAAVSLAQTAPPSVWLGSTEAQVVAALGQPQAISIAGGSKKLYDYPAERVVFVDGKVVDIKAVDIRDVARTTPDDISSTRRISIPDLLPLEIGFGAAVIALGSFMLGRRERRVTAPRAAPQPPQPEPDRLKELEMLHQLGILTEEEFEHERTATVRERI